MLCIVVLAYLHQDLVVLQGLKVLFSHLDQVHICAFVLRELELNMAPCVLQQMATYMSNITLSAATMLKWQGCKCKARTECHNL